LSDNAINRPYKSHQFSAGEGIYYSELTLTSHDDFGRNLAIQIISLKSCHEEVNMLKRTSAGWVKIFCLFSFALLISAALIPGAGVTPAFAAKKADTQKKHRSCGH